MPHLIAELSVQFPELHVAGVFVQHFAEALNKHRARGLQSVCHDALDGGVNRDHIAGYFHAVHLPLLHLLAATVVSEEDLWLPLHVRTTAVGEAEADLVERDFLAIVRPEGVRADAVTQDENDQSIHFTQVGVATNVLEGLEGLRLRQVFKDKHIVAHLPEGLMDVQ